ncbi:GNAT family N-acetyltransferase [Pelagibacterium halotolerans]|uniref:GNAT family N-acetyltransferase n=1 Tax=Pelagibacterium halotolerans TaxID=531813 RepID=UPI003851693E
MHPQHFAIRPALPAEADIVRQISADAYIPAYQATIGAIPKPVFEDYRPRIARGEVWLLETDRPIGVLVLEDKAGHLLVYSIAVSPEHAGRGYATGLLEFAEHQAVDRGRPEIRLYTNSRMTGNLRLYAKCGFAEIGTRPHPNRPGEILVDMAKPVAPRPIPPSPAPASP